MKGDESDIAKLGGEISSRIENDSKGRHVSGEGERGRNDIGGIATPCVRVVRGKLEEEKEEWRCCGEKKNRGERRGEEGKGGGKEEEREREKREGMEGKGG